MLTYIIRRFLLLFPTLFGVVLLVFLVVGMSPGGIGGAALNKFDNMNAEQTRYMRAYYDKRYGLNRPLIAQFARWVNQISPVGFRDQDDQGHLHHLGFKWPNLGESLVRHRPVVDLLKESLPVTILLNALTIPLIYGVGVISGLLAARSRGKWLDVGSGGVFLALWSVPAIWAGVMLIGMLANREYIKLFPTGGLHEMMSDQMPFLPHWTVAGFERGYLLDELWHLALPLVCMTYGGFAYLSKLTRGSVLDNLNTDFVRTARAKGVSERDVLFRHVFRNSLLALVTIAAGIIPGLLGGSIVIETLFSVPGMGKLMFDAVEFKDRELILATTLIFSFIGLAFQIIRDVWYAVVDPRVTYE